MIWFSSKLSMPSLVQFQLWTYIPCSHLSIQKSASSVPEFDVKSSIEERWCELFYFLGRSTQILESSVHVIPSCLKCKARPIILRFGMTRPPKSNGVQTRGQDRKKWPPEITSVSRQWKAHHFLSMNLIIHGEMLREMEVWTTMTPWMRGWPWWE